MMGRRTGGPSLFAGKALANAAVAPAAGSTAGPAGSRWSSAAFGEWPRPPPDVITHHVPGTRYQKVSYTGMVISSSIRTWFEYFPCSLV